jgi:hypothetical protein
MLFNYYAHYTLTHHPPTIQVDTNGMEVATGFAQRHPKNLFTLEEAEVRAAMPDDAPASLVQLTLQW